MKDLNESSNENLLRKCYLCVILEVKLEFKLKKTPKYISLELTC